MEYNERPDPVPTSGPQVYRVAPPYQLTPEGRAALHRARQADRHRRDTRIVAVALVVALVAMFLVGMDAGKTLERCGSLWGCG